MAVAKPIVSLVREDLQKNLIWTYLVEPPPEADETWVRPLRGRVIPSGHYSLSVAARFVLWCGRIEYGFMDVSTDAHVPEVLPGALVTPSYLVLPLVTAALARKRRNRGPILERRALLSALKLSESEVYPIQFLLAAKFDRDKSHHGGLIY